MPIFEYKCNDCNSKFDILHKSITKQEDVFCPECNSSNNKKLLSTFSAANSSSSSSGDYCSTGTCGVPQTGGCASGMCGLN